MNLAKCWLCNVSIDDSLRHEEHIIPRSLGGRKTVTDFICKKCNNDTGSKWDEPLLESVRALVSIACAGPPGKGRPSQWLMAGGKPINQYPDGRWELAADLPLRLASRIDSREFEIHGQPHLNNIAKEIGDFKGWIENFSSSEVGFDVKAVSSSIRVERKVTDEEIEARHDFLIGDRESVKSILKSILALAYQAEVDSSNCLPLLAYLRGTPRTSLMFYMVCMEETMSFKIVATKHFTAFM